jgi:heme-degrading monooxygenase HmoA
MIAVIFEVWPEKDGAKSYFDLAASLRPLLEGVDGFISIERFESVTTKGKYLSLSFWRDEQALGEWRNLSKHREAQELGRGQLFSDYRIRVASVVRDYGMNDRDDAPEDSRGAHG